MYALPEGGNSLRICTTLFTPDEIENTSRQIRDAQRH
jgi:hypothetical protein